MNSIYYDILKLNYKPVITKRILISTVEVCFKALFSIPVIYPPPDISPPFVSPSKIPYEEV